MMILTEPTQDFSSVHFLPYLGPVVRRVDNFIQQINPYPADKLGAFLILIGQRANFIHKLIDSSYNWAQKVTSCLLEQIYY